MARQFRSGPRRKTQWAGFGSNTGTAVLPQVLDLSTGTALILSSGMIVGGSAGLVDEEVTITRTLPSIFAGVRVATAEEAATIAIGCGVFRSEAVAAGVGSLPSPEDDPDFEWLYYGVFPLSNAIGAQSEGSEWNVWKTMPDVRGQRVVRSGYTVAWLAESQNANAMAGVGGRYLVKLP